MNWEYERTLSGNILLPVGVVRTPDIAIHVADANGATDWNRAGYLYPLVDVGGGDLPARGIYIRFDSQAVRVPYAAYKLQFKPVWYVKSYILKFARLDCKGLDCQDDNGFVPEQLDQIERLVDELNR